MPLPAFPANMSPNVSRGYSFGAPNNIIEQPLEGGTALQMRDFAQSFVDFSVVISGSPLKIRAFQDFYFHYIDSGASKFTMDLDSGNGIEEHTVQIVASSMRFDTNDTEIWVASFTVRSDTTPFQTDPYAGGLIDLYETHGEGLNAYVDLSTMRDAGDLPTIP